ncbi:MAG: hypothetical protein JNL08_02760 [Planctomycetes bacterium]|nr:hypothetical protein [Planctomycetota bacterium]
MARPRWTAVGADRAARSARCAGARHAVLGGRGQRRCAARGAARRRPQPAARRARDGRRRRQADHAAGGSADRGRRRVLAGIARGGSPRGRPRAHRRRPHAAGAERRDRRRTRARTRPRRHVPRRGRGGGRSARRSGPVGGGTRSGAARAGRAVAAPPRPGAAAVARRALARSDAHVTGATAGLLAELRAFAAFGTATRTSELDHDGTRVPVFTNEFWTAAQREGHSLHEVSYRACFKPSLPAFFVERLSRPGDRVLDPFMGRGTTPLEALLRGRVPCGNDVNPLSTMLLRPRLCPPPLSRITARIGELDLGWHGPLDDDLLAFFHPDTLRAICALRTYLLARERAGSLDAVDDWIRMVALNRLTGHSTGFFSVYTLPPNQAVTADAQRKINAKRAQTPPCRDVRAILTKKSAALLADVSPLWAQDAAVLAQRAVLSSGPAEALPALADASVQLVVTSPPFLDVVQYADDNWLRCWFGGIDASAVPITMARTVATWQAAMTAVFRELHRVVRPGGFVAFEVGEVRRGKVRLEEAVVPAAREAGLVPELVMVNAQRFTKTANCWGIDNNKAGTNTNRIVLLRRD